MSGNGKGTSDAEASAGKSWPYCASIEGTCIAYDMGRFLGAGVQSTLFSFIFSADRGARLILQKNREGFTVQVTGSVQTTQQQKFGLAEARAVRKHLDQMREGEERQT